MHNKDKYIQFNFRDKITRLMSGGDRNEVRLQIYILFSVGHDAGLLIINIY